MGESSEVVRFCAIECELQRSGERSVWWMLNAWTHAARIPRPLTAARVVELGEAVEPVKNARGFRQVAVRVGWDVKPDWRLIPRQMEGLVGAADVLEPAEWFRQYEEVHPFVDGNGRTGQILYNLLNGTLDHPVWAPNFWDDPRRVPGDGGPDG